MSKEKSEWKIVFSEEIPPHLQTFFYELDELRKENKKLKEDVDYFRQCYLDLKKLCEKEWFMATEEEVTKMFNLGEIK